MDKYEYRVRADEIKQLIAQGDYVQAAEIADTIDWRRVRNVKMLCTVSDLYKMNRRYEDARDLMLLAYENRPGGRNICYALCELSIKMVDIVHAIEYYKEFVMLAPKDPGRYVLQYQLYEAQEVSLEERIEVLEELKKRDYSERWAYELAYLYHRVGLATRCVEECDELISMLGEGKYVDKAMELKMLHQPLTPEQQAKYDSRFDQEIEETEPAAENEDGEMAYQDQDSQPAYGDEGSEALTDTVVYEPVYPAETGNEEVSEPETAPEPEEADELDIQVKTVDVGEYNTINLQAEIAQGLKEVLGSEAAGSEAAGSEQETPPEEEPEIPDAAAGENIFGSEEEVEETEVFFGETGNIGELPLSVPDKTGEIVMEQMRREAAGQEMPSMLTIEPPKEMAHVLAQDSDGQLSFVIPDSQRVERQITGQINIEDILAEWERMKQENEEKRKEDVRQHVLQQTGRMFTEFDAAVRDGLLEQLEKDVDEELRQEKAGGEFEQELEIEEAGEDTEAEEMSEGEEAEPAMEVEEEAETEAEEETGEAPEDVESGVVTESEEGSEEAGEAGEMSEAGSETEAEEGSEEAGEAPEAAVATESEEGSGETESKAEAADQSETAKVPEDVLTESDEVEELEEVAEEAAEEDTEEDKESSDEDVAAYESLDGDEETEETTGSSEKSRVRPMTQEEQELYAPFIQNRTTREQIVLAVDNMSLAAYTGNVIITGEEGMDTLSLAKNMVKEAQASDSNFSGKIAKISGRALNKKEVKDIVRSLQNGALIIRKACGMESKTVQELYRILQQENLGIIIVMEDSRKAMNSFLKEYKELLTVFTVRVDVEAMSNDTLVAFGRQYAHEKEYSIDELGILALHTRIEERQTLDHAVTAPEVKAMVDDAIHHANKKNIQHFFDILLFKRYDEEDMIVLTEKDFA